MINKLSENSVKLCCNRRGCAYITKESPDQFSVEDELGNKILITRYEILNLSKAAKQLEKMTQDSA